MVFVCVSVICCCFEKGWAFAVDHALSACKVQASPVIVVPVASHICSASELVTFDRQTHTNRTVSMASTTDTAEKRGKYLRVILYSSTTMKPQRKRAATAPATQAMAMVWIKQYRSTLNFFAIM